MIDTGNFVMEDCIFIGEAHREGPQCDLIRAGIARLREVGAELPPSLIEWEEHMERIREWEARRALRT